MFTAEHIPYRNTNAFSKIVLDYLDAGTALSPFYTHKVSLDGIAAAIELKSRQDINRTALLEVLTDQYKTIVTSPIVTDNIKALQSANTYTICTAHQPNLFTGHLYFIYKILHTIKFAEYLSTAFPQNKFVPVYYMGSEDADFAELNHFTAEGKLYEWKSNQQGAVGRMLNDKSIASLIEELQKQLGVYPFGEELIQILKESYKQGTTVQDSIFQLVNTLFSSHGLVVLIADDKRLKQQMLSVFEDDIFNNQPAKILNKTCKELALSYDVQASPRDINLFYLDGDIRERFLLEKDIYKVNNTEVHFTSAELKALLKDHPENFSPNVILRGLFQETILPNVAFIGGGGELAYWLQLKDLFSNYNIPFPVLVLRNSFLIIENKQEQLLGKLELGTAQLFSSELDIINSIIEREGKKPSLNDELEQLKLLYDQLKATASNVDVSLLQHVEALKVKAIDRLQVLEKKMLRAERKKHEAVQRQVHKLKEQLFPNGSLQERVENFSPYYAKWGAAFIDELYKASLPLEQQFTIITED